MKYIYVFLFAIIVISSCKKLIEIDPPITDLKNSAVFESDNTAEASVVDLYVKMAGTGFSRGNIFSFTFSGSLCSDELINYNQSSYNVFFQEFNNNQITPNNSLIESYWIELYEQIYRSNSIIEGLKVSSQLSDSLKARLEGEAKFIRAFHYFYLVNLYGDVPLVLTTSYSVNNNIAKSDSQKIYEQIIKDLKDAQNLLPDTYSLYDYLRIRATKGVATALLARTYLYLEQWNNAEIEATALIDNSLYSLDSTLTTIFRVESKEAIFQLWSQRTPQERSTFNVSSAGPSNAAFRDGFVNNFEIDDKRWIAWGRSINVNGITYYYNRKYDSNVNPPLDYSTVFRLAELYLIRAEARAEQSKVEDAVSDINVIRKRAGLPETSSVSKEDLLDDVMQERLRELFTEWGHRWLDLKRTGLAEAVLSPIKPSWQSYKLLFPIPQKQIDRDPGMNGGQNSGY